MTLSEELEKAMKAKNIKGKELSKLTGVMAWEISDMRTGGDFRANALKKIASALDAPELLEYVEFKTCPCGENFIPDIDHRRYCSDACRLKYKGNGRGKRQEARANKKNPVSYVERENKARSQGVSYGQLCGAERLAQSGTMRESMGL